MPRLSVLAAFALAVLAPATLTAQPEPDFSGHWVLVESDSGAVAAQSIDVQQDRVVANVYGKPITPMWFGLKISRTFRDHGQTEEYSIGALGGRVDGGVVGSPGEPPSREASSGAKWSVQWKGRDLVIEVTDLADGLDKPPTREHREVWHIGRHSRLVVISTDRTRDGDPVAGRHVYRRVGD
jgi:hypothetical protein